MRIFWFLCGNEVTPSARIHGIRIHKRLNQLGYRSHLVFVPNVFRRDLDAVTSSARLIPSFFKKSDVAIFQKVFGKNTEEFIKHLRRKGLKIIFVDSDLPLKTNIASLSDLVICPSEQLKSMYLEVGIRYVRYIPDAVEVFNYPSTTMQGRIKNVVWFGTSKGSKWESVNWFRSNVLPFIKDRWRFLTISDHKDSDYHWDANSWKIISVCDLVVIPVSSEDADQVKSANRCLQSMALGVPVLCGTVPSYSRVVIDDHNGFLSDDAEEWISFISRLEDEKFLAALKMNAYKTAASFSLDSIILEWIEILALSRRKASSPFYTNSVISIIRLISNLRRSLGKFRVNWFLL